ncbi:hypothetical protein C7S13_0643 [Burkholderia cepacia]|nr:hypothetical protein [Burkholderia cepacia]MDW9243391.1 hypothetical protein [Burkholderia cepacia]
MRSHSWCKIFEIFSGIRKVLFGLLKRKKIWRSRFRNNL